MLLATFRARGEPPCRNCKAWFNHNFYSFMCREMKLLGVFFSACSPEHGWARKNISSLIQWASTAAASLGSGWKFGANLSIFVFMVVFVSCLILSNPFANAQLIAHLLFQSCTGLRGNYSAGDMQWCSASHRLGMRISLSAAPWNRHGREYQTAREETAHKSSCSLLTSCWVQPGA